MVSSKKSLKDDARDLKCYASIDDDESQQEDNGSVDCIEAVLEWLDTHKCLSVEGKRIKKLFWDAYIVGGEE